MKSCSTWALALLMRLKRTIVAVVDDAVGVVAVGVGAVNVVVVVVVGVKCSRRSALGSRKVLSG